MLGHFKDQGDGWFVPDNPILVKAAYALNELFMPQSLSHLVHAFTGVGEAVKDGYRYGAHFAFANTLNNSALELSPGYSDRVRFYLVK